MMERRDFKCKCGMEFGSLARADGDFACPECGEEMVVVRVCPSWSKPVVEEAPKPVEPVKVEGFVERALKTIKKRAPKK